MLKIFLFIFIAIQNVWAIDIKVSNFKNIYDPSIGEKERWYINDHTIIKGPDGLWHMFGITHAEPANPLEEKFFAHATAKNLTDSPWTKQNFALGAEIAKNERLLWAPYVLKHDNLYYMFYCAGGEHGSRYQINLATSKDLWHWQKFSGNPLFIDGFDARDPFVTNINGEWVMYYTANSNASGGNHVVAYRKTRDLIHWSEKKIAFTHSSRGTWGGPTESPFVVEKNGLYYLFNGPINNLYAATAVYESSDPFHFEEKNQVATIYSHALEVIQDNDKWYVTHAGWGQGGLYLAELFW